MPGSSATPMYDFAVLRDLRKGQGLSIGEVSHRSGVSPAVISKLERNRTLAELDTLYRLGRVFGLNPSDLLRLAESRSAQRLEASEHCNHGIRFREIAYGNIRCLLGTARAGARTGKPQVHSDDYEVCWVLSGQVRFRLPHETHDLAAGDAIQFDGVLDHSYEAVADSQFFLVHLRKEKRF